MDRSVDRINLQKQPIGVALAPSPLQSPEQQPVKRKRGRPPKRKKDDEPLGLGSAAYGGNPNGYFSPVSSLNSSQSSLGAPTEAQPFLEAAQHATPVKSGRYDTKSTPQRAYSIHESSPSSPGAPLSHAALASPAPRTPSQKRAKKPYSTLKKRLKQVCVSILPFCSLAGCAPAGAFSSSWPLSLSFSAASFARLHHVKHSILWEACFDDGHFPRLRRSKTAGA